MGQSDTTGCACTGEANQVFRSDIGSENRCTDDEPSEISSGKKVIVGCVLALADQPRGQPQQNPEVGCDEDPIDWCHRVSLLFF